MRHRFTVLLLALVTAGWAHAQSPQPAKPVRKPPAAAPKAPARDPQQLVEDARQKLQEGDAAQALALAQAARRADPESYKASYYIAYALMTLDDFEGAGEAQQRSLQLARSDEQKQVVQDLGRAIAARNGVRDADKAAEEGLDAKAARLYREAFEAGLPRPDVALKAARLYEQRLKEVGTAVALLRAVQERFPGSAAAATAAGELARLKPAVAAEAQKKLRLAHARAPGSRQAMLEEARAIDPDNADVLVALANEAALDAADWPRLEASLKVLQQRRLLQDALKASKLRLAGWQDEPRLRTLLEDAWGGPVARELLQPRRRGVIRIALEATAGGLKVTALGQGGPAEKAGMKVGDLVVGLAGARFPDTATAMREFARLPAALPAVVDVQRGAQALVLYVSPDAAPPITGDCLVANYVQEGITYQGGCKDGFAEGEGRLGYKTAQGNAAVYVGGFAGGLRSGKGTTTVDMPAGPKVFEMVDGVTVKSTPD